MNPDDKQLSHGGGESRSSASRHVPARPRSAQREATANVIRANIEQLYQQDERPTNTNTNTNTENPYLRTREEAVGTPEEQWKAYHSAWQNYYQQYYEAYYHHAKQQEAPQATASSQHPTSHSDGNYFADQPGADESEVMTKDEALYDLRQRLLHKVKHSAKRIRRSRHFVPIIAALVVVLAFVFIQYNKVLIGTVAAYVSPGSLDAQDIIIDPNASVTVTQDPRIIIPKINVDVPVLYDVGNDYDSQMTAMKSGVAHFAIPGANSHPGEVGNTVVAGHSSNDLFDSGDYKFIFAQLEKLVIGDTFYANYHGVRYTYIVTKIEVVKPTDVQALVYPTDKPIMTLLTCTPLGTSLNRLLVIGEQVSPDPAGAAQPAQNTGAAATTLSGANTPSLFERLFGAR